MKKVYNDAYVISPMPDKRVGVKIIVENERSKSIVADDDADYHAQMEELKNSPRFIQGNYIEVKKIVGMLIPVKTEKL